MTEKLIINLPFPGFYHSLYSSEIDSVEERECEYFADHRQTEEGIPKELQLDAREYAEILFRHTDYSAAYHDTAIKYVDAFNTEASEGLGLALGLEWETMTSPREYNFETDRLFAYIAPETVQALFDMSAADKHETLASVIRERFTSYSGFCSFYSNCAEEWLEKPVLEWDHNELGTLLLACMHLHNLDRENEFDLQVYYAVVDRDGLYNEWSNAVDWSKVEADIQELRDEKAEELRADNPDYEPPYRCPDTPDLFAPRA